MQVGCTSLSPFVGHRFAVYNHTCSQTWICFETLHLTSSHSLTGSITGSLGFVQLEFKGVVSQLKT